MVIRRANSDSAVAERYGLAFVPVGVAASSTVSRDILIDVAFTQRPFGVLLSGVTVAAVVGAGQCDGVLLPGDELVALGGDYVWTAVTSSRAVAGALQAASLTASPERPYVLTFLRRAAAPGRGRLRGARRRFSGTRGHACGCGPARV